MLSSHSHCQTKHSGQIPRLKKIEGQIKGIQNMITDDRYCIDILMQLKSIKNALVKVEENILREHIKTCVNEAFQNDHEEGRDKKIEEIIGLINKYT